MNPASTPPPASASLAPSAAASSSCSTLPLLPPLVGAACECRGTCWSGTPRPQAARGPGATPARHGLPAASSRPKLDARRLLLLRLDVLRRHLHPFLVHRLAEAPLPA